MDDYLLKPVSISKMTAILQSMEQKLSDENTGLEASVLPAIACGQPYPAESAAQLYSRKRFRFAMIRWGNQDMTLPRVLTASSLVLPKGEHFQVLRGRDDDERILIAPEEPMEEYLTHLSVYMTQRGGISTWTAVYTPACQEIETLPAFIEWSITLLYRKTVIGKHQILQYAGGTLSKEHMRLPASEMKQLTYFISSGKYRLIKDYFMSLAMIWEKEQLPQREVWHLGRQLIHQTSAVLPSVGVRQEELLSEFNDFIRNTASCGELMAATYSLLFDNGNMADRKLSPQELYDYAIQYIDENYAQPLSMQSVCDEIGISQTYLSRLFRKYSETTFNAYLTRCRMEAAMVMLREKPDLLLRDVAACVGYDDSSYFTKVFHQYTGKTPSQFTSET